MTNLGMVKDDDIWSWPISPDVPDHKQESRLFGQNLNPEDLQQKILRTRLVFGEHLCQIQTCEGVNPGSSSCYRRG